MNERPEVQPVGREYELVWEDGELLVNEESIFQVIRSIKDPEHNYSLEELRVVSLERVCVQELLSGHLVRITVVPTIPHCSMVGLIGLSILYKLSNTLSSKYVVRVEVQEGSHTLAEEVSKQLSDIERTYSAFLNENIVSAISPLL
ncbi:uncharacterized protein NEMAJ01_2146 [Nematocida major]|uniref:uncharacterized protein n=1 Tax=Nematocida major TaxID=1912982 RepID=UPI0020086031|nr:uncharacterized protein NEMAJ01_2146 [Nematocida major]KAH9387250.1 hypothetical protein NEMAJ01_2146 [Nematocida major]